jgi:DNA ligase 4
MARDAEMQDADAEVEEQEMYRLIPEEEFQKYPNRPHNLHKTLPFHSLMQALFNPLEQSKKRRGTVKRARVSTYGAPQKSVTEERNEIIDNFIKTWREKAGNDIYPAMRLIVPDQDRDRAMYGLKEKTIAKLLVRVIGINKTSDDAAGLVNWKLPGNRSSASAGDFAARCFEVLSKRPLRSKYGDMTIGEVNIQLDKLSVLSKEDEQFPIFQEFYQKMNAEELMWLIRMILRQMKIGASEKTLFLRWHKDAETLFNVSSSLRRVCWELWDANVSLDGDMSNISLMECFQPQLAAFQLHSFDEIVNRMDIGANGVFWIEEKLDGERLQMHMQQNDSVPGGFTFKFWSRKAKDYTYLYGSGFEDTTGSLTKFFKGAFHSGVRNIILDGEMVSWNMSEDKVQPFGNLKSAAIAQQDTEDTVLHRPVYRVFDCLYLNDSPLTGRALEKRREALNKAVLPVHRRLEIHQVFEGRTAQDIEDKLREMVATASEGLVVKNIKSPYRLNERNDDWIKVKPEYMSEFGEELDVLVIGGYYGSGHRGGGISSFLCGLRLDKKLLEFDPTGKASSEKCWSFCKVGGGFGFADYKQIAQLTEGKWHDWNSKNPPTEYIELGGSKLSQVYSLLHINSLKHPLPANALENYPNLKDLEYERPDVWIRPSESIVISVKAASLGVSKQFRVSHTLRFPRFRTLRLDKTWDQTLTVEELFALNRRADEEHTEHKMELDKTRKEARKARTVGTRKRKKPLILAGTEASTNDQQGGAVATDLFANLKFFVASAWTAGKKSKAEIENAIKSHGGTVVQNRSAANTNDESEKQRFLVISDAGTLPARSVQKEGKMNIIRPLWIFDCIELHEQSSDETQELGQDFLLPFEKERHAYFVVPADNERFEGNVDEYGDSYCRNVKPDELHAVFNKMNLRKNGAGQQDVQLTMDIIQDKAEVAELPGNMFSRTSVVFASYDDQDEAGFKYSKLLVTFGGGTLIPENVMEKATQIVVGGNIDRPQLEALRKKISRQVSTLFHVIILTLPDSQRFQGLSLLTGCWTAGGKRLCSMRQVSCDYGQMNVLTVSEFALL